MTGTGWNVVTGTVVIAGAEADVPPGTDCGLPFTDWGFPLTDWGFPDEHVLHGADVVQGWAWR